MLNQSGITTVSGTTRKTILVDEKNSTAVSVVVDATGVDADANSKKILKAGTPMYGNLESRNTAFVKASTSGGTKGTWTCAISTAFAEDETIVINGVTYTCGSTQDKATKVFAGANAGAQAASLVAIVEDDKFDLTNTSGTITFTQKIADSSGSAPVVTTTATTGAIGSVTAGTSPVSGTNNANCILLHDVDVTGLSGGATKNSQVVIFGTIDISKLELDVQALITSDVKDNLKMIQFVK